jgi:hypothetical protein
MNNYIKPVSKPQNRTGGAGGGGPSERLDRGEAREAVGWDEPAAGPD